MKPAIKFKDTEIGLIPEKWDIFDIQTVSDVIGGGTPSTTEENNFNGEIPWITPRDLSSYQNRFISCGARCISEKGLNSSSAKLLPIGTILLTTRAPVGYLAIANNKVTTNQGFHSLIPNYRTTSLFLFYLLKNNVEKLISHASGSTFQELSGKTLKALKFAFPTIDEQKKTAEILSSLDDKIELNHRINTNLEAVASALFKKWFVDIGDELPEGWKRELMTDYVIIDKGISYKSSDLNEKGKNLLIGLKCFDRGGGFKINGVKRYSGEFKQQHLLQMGDLIVAMTDLTQGAEVLGKPAIVPNIKNADYVVASLDISIIRPKTKIISRAYLYLFFKRRETQDFLFGFSNGSTVLHLSINGLRQIKIIIPPEEEMQEFNSLVEPVFEKMQVINGEINNLIEIRDSLLPQLISGKIQLK
ncbi:MAG: restriction endonuclease subunit S [Sphaerochaetaceae bacterium]